MRVHAAEVAFLTPRGEEVLRAPLAAELVEFCRQHLGVRVNQRSG
jgi:hypothetical protein